MRLQVHEDGAERASALERKIIDAKLDDLSDWRCRQSHDAPENSEPAGLDAHVIRHAHAQSATSRQANDLDEVKQSCGHPRPRGDKGGQTLGKDFARTGGDIAEKFAHREQEAHRLPGTGQISQSALIATMYTSRSSATSRTLRAGLRGTYRDAQGSLLARARSHLKASR